MDKKRVYINLKKCGMIGIKVLMIAVVTMLLPMLVVREAGAQPININSCTVISSPGEYILNADIMKSSDQVCISITSSDVIFDGAYHIIEGIGGNNTIGVYVNNPNMALTNVTVKNLIVRYWTIGIYLGDSADNILTNNEVYQNNLVGIDLENSSNNNTLTNNEVYSNFVGIGLGNSSNNNIQGNVVGYSADHNDLTNNNGLVLLNSGGNNIYDNYFNNTNNTIFIEPILSNYWNTTTKREGYRIIRSHLPSDLGYDYYIIGDPNLGGNFWANQSGTTGFSLTCADGDKNGICDSPYKINGNNIDYLPLTPLKQFKAVDLPVYNSTFIEWQQEFKKFGVLDIFAESLNSKFVIPYDVTVDFKECGVENAYYSPLFKSINLCYELPYQMYYRDFASALPNESQRISAVANTTVFIFYHEAGHALINVLKLPITGREEDVTDQIATYTFINSGQGDAALSAAEWMHILAQQTNISNDIFWDTHSFGEERFANILCWVYGSNPQKYYYLVPDYLPQQRSLSCSGEFEQMNNSLNTLFGPYLLTSTTATPNATISPTAIANNSSISGMKFNDSNGNGIMDPNESGLPKWTIQLTNESNTTVTMMTDTNGNYTFSNLAAGNYTVSEVLQAGWKQTFPVAPGMYNVTLMSGQNLTSMDFGNFISQTFSISGFKLNNATGSGISGWNITLTNSTMQTTTMTNMSGFYEFTGLTNGTYNVTEGMEAGFIPTNATSRTVTIENMDVMDMNFTNQPVIIPPVTVTSFVLTPNLNTTLKGMPISIAITALNGNVSQTLFNGTTNINITANNVSAVSSPMNVSFTNGNATIQVTSSVAQFVNVTATSTTAANISGSTQVMFADKIFSLSKGWNLISIPNFAEPSNVSQLLKNVQNNGVVGFDSSTGNFKTPTDLEPLFGYWINVTADNQSIGFIASTTIPSMPPTRKLFEGWNLIGVSASRNDPDTLSAGELFVDLKHGSDFTQWLYTRMVSFEQPAAPVTLVAGTDLSDTTALKQGHGYWLFIKDLSSTSMNNVPWAGKQ